MTTEDTLRVPDSKRLANVQWLCDLTAPYETGPEQDELFVKAMQEIVAWHRDKCEFYNALLLKENFTPEQLDKVSDCIRLPLIHANFFKTHEFVIDVPVLNFNVKCIPANQFVVTQRSGKVQHLINRVGNIARTGKQ